MELERRNIERRDFPPTRRGGYDPDEVDRHLRAIADAVEQLKTRQPQQASLAGTAAQRVESIVAAAEASAREIEERANADAQATREQASASAADQVRRAEEVASALIERGKQVQAQVDELVAELRRAADGITGTLNEGAAGLRHELDSMRQDLGSVRAAAAAAPAAGAESRDATVGPVADAEPPEEDVIVAVPEPDLEPEPHPEPQLAGPEAEPEPEPEPEPPAEAPTEPVQAARPAANDAGRASEGARLIALNMALSGTPREETARYLAENFDLEDQDELLDDVYARVGS
jgi:DivIVA domain-containing protein